jgi:prepilin-type N-terminal cleavage/methylation domain-containing protein
MRTPLQREGFTLVEILLTISILAMITAVSLSAFRSVYRSSGARVAAQEVADAFRESRNNTLSSKNDTVYGVYVGTSSVTRFVGDTYTFGNASNTVYTFEAGATATGTLVSNGVSVIFGRLTGVPNATGTILIRDIDDQNTATITVENTGLIQY